MDLTRPFCIKTRFEKRLIPEFGLFPEKVTFSTSSMFFRKKSLFPNKYFFRKKSIVDNMQLKNVTPARKNLDLCVNWLYTNSLSSIINSGRTSTWRVARTGGKTINQALAFVMEIHRSMEKSNDLIYNIYIQACKSLGGYLKSLLGADFLQEMGNQPPNEWSPN